MTRLRIWQASLEEEDGEWDVYITHNRTNDYWRIALLLPKPITIETMLNEVSLIFQKKKKKNKLGKIYINGRQWPYREAI